MAQIVNSPLDAEQDALLRIIRRWPRERQERLAQAILQVAERSHASFEDARGLLATPGKPAPSDEDIERWRLEKYDE